MLCGIYDLAGNVYEWTLEKTSDINRPCGCRGGNYGDNGSAYSVFSRYDNSATVAFSDLGFRVALW